MDNKDVVIAGGGPVGLMLACELALAGVDVLVVERLLEIDPTIKAGSINVPTAEALYRRGMLPVLQEHQRLAYEQMKAFRGGKAAERSAAGRALRRDHGQLRRRWTSRIRTSAMPVPLCRSSRSASRRSSPCWARGPPSSAWRSGAGPR